jgi:hypothetical protein
VGAVEAEVEAEAAAEVAAEEEAEAVVEEVVEEDCQVARGFPALWERPPRTQLRW